MIYVLIFLAAYLILIAAPAVAMYLLICGRVKRDSVDYSVSKPTRILYKAELQKDIALYDAMPYSEVKITNKGIDLTARYIDNGGSYIALLCHGYHAYPSVNFALYARVLRQRGFDLLAINERGHEGSGGKCSMAVCEGSDILAWCDFIKKTYHKPVLIIGVSMGAASAMSVCDSFGDDIKGAVYDCGFVSAYNQIMRECKYRHLPATLILQVVRACFWLEYKRDCKRGVLPALKNTHTPALFVYSSGDKTVPLREGVLCYNTCTADKDIIVTLDAGHTMALYAGDAPAMQQLNNFLDKYFTEA